MKLVSWHRWLVLALVLVWLPQPSGAQTLPQWITIGENATPEQRAALLQRFAAAPSDVVVTTTLPDLRARVQSSGAGLPDAPLVLGTAVSCAAAGTGVRVTAENITRVGAAMYAAALVTAGVNDAAVLIVAPQDAPTDGLAALPAVLSTVENCSGPLDQRRRDLAFRQLTLVVDLAQTVGDPNKAAMLVNQAQQILVREKNNPDAAVPIVEGVQRDAGITLPEPQFQALVVLLATLGQAQPNWGQYAAGWTLQTASETEARTVPQGGAGSGLFGDQVLRGTVTGTNPLQVSVPGVTQEFSLIANSLAVTRNNEPSSLAALQVGDTVAITVDANNVAVQLAAAAGTANGNTPLDAGAGAQPQTQPAAASEGGLARWLPLLLLLILVGIAAYFYLNYRRRQANRLVYTEGPTITPTDDDEFRL